MLLRRTGYRTAVTELVPGGGESCLDCCQSRRIERVVERVMLAHEHPPALRDDDADEKQDAGNEACHRQSLLQIGRFKLHLLDAADLTRAEERFRELTQRGFIAVALGKDGAENRLLRTFDPQSERTLFIPQLEGG